MGSSVGRWALAKGASLPLVVTRTPLSRERAERLGRPRTVSFGDFARWLRSADGSEAIDCLLLTTSDSALGPLAGQWAQALADRALESTDIAPPVPVVLHAAGSLDAEILAPLRPAGVAVGSLHPLRAFAEVLEEPESRGFYALDGDEAACTVGRRLVSAWDGIGFELAGERRLIYHLAASLAAGGVVTVLAAVARLMAAAELPDELLEGYLRLLRGAVAPVSRPADAAPSITGPAARGDAETLAAHLRALRATAPDLEPLVTELWRATERLSRRR